MQVAQAELPPPLAEPYELCPRCGARVELVPALTECRRGRLIPCCTGCQTRYACNAELAPTPDQITAACQAVLQVRPRLRVGESP